MRTLKILLLCSFIVAIPGSLAEDLPNPDESNLANFHLLDETCAGQCHEKEEPSDSLEFELSSCIECHDALGELEGRQHNLKHLESEQMECTDCHLPHEEFDPVEMCVDCHDEDDEELKDFYSSKRMNINHQFASAPLFKHLPLKK
jgi:hypothetical protein